MTNHKMIINIEEETNKMKARLSMMDEEKKLLKNKIMINTVFLNSVKSLEQPRKRSVGG